MKFSFFEEPDLEFANGGTHVVMRFGIARFGLLDFGDTKAPAQLKVGFVGTDETISAMKGWLERCKSGISAKDSKLANLFPNSQAFPLTHPSAPRSCFTSAGLPP